MLKEQVEQLDLVLEDHQTRPYSSALRYTLFLSISILGQYYSILEGIPYISKVLVLFFMLLCTDVISRKYNVKLNRLVFVYSILILITNTALKYLYFDVIDDKLVSRFLWFLNHSVIVELSEYFLLSMFILVANAQFYRKALPSLLKVSGYACLFYLVSLTLIYPVFELNFMTLTSSTQIYEITHNSFLLKVALSFTIVLICVSYFLRENMFFTKRNHKEYIGMALLFAYAVVIQMTYIGSFGYENISYASSLILLAGIIVVLTPERVFTKYYRERFIHVPFIILFSCFAYFETNTVFMYQYIALAVCFAALMYDLKSIRFVGVPREYTK